MKTYKALLLDWDDTIGDFHNAAYRSLQDIYAGYGLDACYDSFDDYYAVYSEHNTYLWEQYGLDRVTKDYLEFDRFFYPQMMAPHPFPIAKAIEQAQRMAQDHLHHTTDYFSPLPGAVDAVRRLATRYPLIIVSNGFVSVQYKKIELSGLRDCFAHIVLSEEVGCQKPNPKIYQEALRRCGLAADEVMMIGDSWTSDIQGAQAAGIDQMCIVDPAKPTDPDRTATYKVADLSDAARMLV